MSDLGIYLQEKKAYVHAKIFTQIFIAAFFLRDKNYK